MEFEWESEKAAINLKKHHVPFEYATRIFLDSDRLDSVDDRREYGEERRYTLGRIEGRVFAVSYTKRNESIRLISARKANERETKRYEKILS